MELLTDEELEQILAQMVDGFFSDYEKERFLAIIEQELEYREKMRNKKFGEFGRRSDEREEDDKQKDHIETNDDGDLFQLLRESQHRYYYMLANTSLINGLTANMEYVEITPWWQTALYAVDGGLAILTVMLLVAYIVAFRKNKSEN